VIDKPPSEKPEIRYVNLYEPEAKIYTRKITGFYQRLRRYSGIPLVALFVLLPWISIEGRPAVWLDMAHEKFHILHLTFWPQDLMLLAWLFIIAAFGLFTVSTVFGRVWCGFSCPQTVWTMMYIVIEDFCEGDRNKRIKLDKQTWNPEKIARKGGKHVLWLLIAFLTGITFVGYFIPAPELVTGMIPHIKPDGHWGINLTGGPIFFVLLCSGMTYLNAGWMREQVCKYMCPYSRFQAAMYDKDTIYVQYDEARGEQRGPRKPNEDYKSKGLGDCTDCSWCVQVCPVNIDIRNGTQWECINCGLCVDACDTVMDKMDYPRGLVRFTSETQLTTGKANIIRPKTIGYALAMLAMIIAFSYRLSHREPLGVDVVRDRSPHLFRLDGDDVQNVYTVKINNMDQIDHMFVVEVTGAFPFRVLNSHPVKVKSGEVFSLPIRVAVEKSQLKGEKNSITISAVSQDNSLKADEESTFMGPVQDDNESHEGSGHD
jgi:cytochrome c oxidase accessory protein FixG